MDLGDIFEKLDKMDGNDTFFAISYKVFEQKWIIFRSIIENGRIFTYPNKNPKNLNKKYVSRA